MTNNRITIKKWARIIRWPKVLGSARVKLSIAMALSVFTLVLLAQLANLLPDRNTPIMQARQLQTQTLAMTGSAMSQSRSHLKDLKKVLEHAVQADEQLLSAGLRDADQNLLIEVEQHQQFWKIPSHGKSNDEFMFVPIFRGHQEFAQLELRYRSLTDVASLFQSPIVKFGACLFATCLVIFYVILGRTLKQLDPRGAVPKHVREAFDHMAEGLLILDRRGSIMMANSKFGTLVGLEPENLVGQNCSDFPWRDSKELPWDQAVRLQSSISNLTLQIEDQEAVLRTFSVSAAPVFAGRGTCRGVMVTFDDVTALEEHKLELIEARKVADAANEAKSNFLSRMSHEIRTPMNAIIGYADILREGVSNQADQHQYLSTIHSSGEHLMTLINDILDLSKIEAGQMTLEKRRFSIAPLLSQVVSTLKLKTDQKNLALELKIEGSIPAHVVNDETRLRQVLINVLGNAVKFTERGGIMLVVRMSKCGKLLEFDIADSGVGIAQEALDTIFNPFSQADNSVTRKFGGTGLGLAICKELSESMGGTIGVRSELGSGTVFSFTINPGTINDETIWITNPDVATRSESKPQKKSTVSRFQPRHILVVDDGQTNRKLAGVILTRMGLSFEEACNGLEAIEMISRNEFDVVLMDISMPIMDGITAAEKLRAMGSTVPLVALTALASKEERERCLNGGFDEFLPKPIRSDKLIEILQKFIPLSTEPDASSAGMICDVKTPTPTVDLSKLAPEPSGDSDLILPEIVRCNLPMDADLHELLIDYVRRMRVRLTDFDKSWKAGDVETLQIHAHWLAGSAGTIGLEEFVKPAREIEKSDGSNPDRIEQLLKFIHELAARVDLTGAALTS